MMRHVKTDPICRLYRKPRGWLSRWRADRRRGWPCERCFREYVWTHATHLCTTQCAIHEFGSEA